jgi:hypothetical protein
MAHASALTSHLSVLQTSASLYASRPAFYVPQVLSESGDVESWSPVSYTQFLADVELLARHWAHVLKLDGIPQRSVIGMWLVNWRLASSLVTSNNLSFFQAERHDIH